ncbi:hypothetical protein ASG40_20050 [Methylobacterium sp. Leaf399]|nr:hypothetical protein ASG40_20050 [Methylobacterium sp. Leaf399]
MDQGSVVLGLLGLADEDGAEAVEPGMGALDDPAPSLSAAMALVLDLLAPGAQVQDEAVLPSQSAGTASS